MRCIQRIGTTHPIVSISCAMSLLAIAALCLLPTAFGDEVMEDPVHLDMGMTVNALGDVGANDAVAAFITYANNFAADRGLSVDIQATVFDNLADLRRSMEQGKLRVTGLQVQEYLELYDDVPLDLLFKAERSGITMERYLILVRADSEVTDLSMLRNKDFRILAGTHMGLARIWLDSLLMEAGLSPAEDFFRRVAEDKSASRVVLPVFFGKEEACLVNELGFKTMAELNPQVARQLRVLHESPEFVTFVICMRHDFTGVHREQTEESYLDAHLYPRGQQVLMLFRYDRLLPCLDQDLDSARTLIERHTRLLNSRHNELENQTSE